MKKIYLAFLAVACFAAAACEEDKLEIPQKGVIAYEDFYNDTDENAISAMTSAYQDFALNIAGNDGIYVPHMMLFNICADDLYAAGEFYGDNDQFAELNEFRYDSQSTVVDAAYKRFYYAIYGCNLVIDNFTPDTDVKKRIVAEARVLRAWCHLMLAIGWNCPPLIDHVLNADDLPANYEGGHDALLEWCAKECAEAAPNLDERAATTDKDGAVKVTRGLAYTVQGKALLFKGDYAGAKAALKNVITSNKYALVPGDRLHEIWHIEGDGNEEKVFEVNLAENTNIGDWSNKIQRSSWMQINVWNWRSSKLQAAPLVQGVQGWGGLGVEENFAKALYANEPDSYRRKATMLTFEEFITELPYASDQEGWTKEDKLADKERGVSNTLGLYGQPGFLHNKMIASKADVVNGWYSFKNYIIFRYAEVLLMYAECCAQTGDDDGAQYLKQIQERAGAPVTAFTLDNVKREKQFELWCEGTRWPDMVRWGDFTSGRMPTCGNNIPTTIDEFFIADSPNYGKKHVARVTYSNPNADAKKKTTFDAQKHIYFPFPFNETSNNPNIVQNSGWGAAK